MGHPLLQGVRAIVFDAVRTVIHPQPSAPVVYAEVPGAQHAFDIFPSLRTAHVIRAIERFVDFVYTGHRSHRPVREGAA